MQTFTIAYRSGGTSNCVWTRVLEVYGSHAEARAAADDIERMGYKVLIYKTDSLNAIGLPIGWDAQTVIDPQHVTVSQYRTTHVVPY
jgi:hypothetical protein